MLQQCIEVRAFYNGLAVLFQALLDNEKRVVMRWESKGGREIEKTS